MKWSAQFLLFSITLLVCSGSLNAESAKNRGALIESISYEKNDQNLETIVFKLNGTHIPKIFKIKGKKPRLVFDFIDTRYTSLINNIINTEGNLIKRVRVGIHNDPPKTRVVVDLKSEEAFKFEQDFLAPDNILSITFHRHQPDDPAIAGDLQRTTALPPVEAPSTALNQTGAAGWRETENRGNQALAGQDAKKAQQQIARQGAAEKTGIAEPTQADGASAPRQEAGTIDREVLSPAAPAERGPSGPDQIELSPRNNPILEQLAGPARPALEPILLDVRFEKNENDSEMVLFKLNDFYPPIVFGIEEGNPRVVCDFLDTALGKNVTPVLRTGGEYLYRIRTATHVKPGKVRVVLDLVPNRNYDLQQVFFKEDDLFVIIISAFDEAPSPTLEVPENPFKAE